MYLIFGPKGSTCTLLYTSITITTTISQTGCECQLKTLLNHLHRPVSEVLKIGRGIQTHKYSTSLTTEHKAVCSLYHGQQSDRVFFNIISHHMVNGHAAAEIERDPVVSKH